LNDSRYHPTWYRAESNPSTNSIRSRAVGGAIHNGTATVTRPGDQFFQKRIGLFDEGKASFKGLKTQKNTYIIELGKRFKKNNKQGSGSQHTVLSHLKKDPNTSTEGRYGPGDPDQQNQPENGEQGVFACHGRWLQV
jgi:hypothetical protein